MNLEVVTIDDCLDMLYKKGFYTVIHDGQVIAFVKEGEDIDVGLQALWSQLRQQRHS